MNWNWSSCWKWGSEVPSHDATSVGLITTLTSELATETCNQPWQKSNTGQTIEIAQKPSDTIQSDVFKEHVTTCFVKIGQT